jgi:hypothetical protein
LPNATFTKTATISDLKVKDKEINCQGFGLVTESGSENVYMIALTTFYTPATYEDWGYLFKIDTSSWTMDSITNKHFINSGGIVGIDGTHFRWGAGIRVTPDGKLVLLATSRNIVAGGLNLNYWMPKG